jgi:hypothetical protein
MKYEKSLMFAMYVFQIFTESFKDQSINSLDDELLKAGDLLEEIDPRKQSCLRTFTDCFELVTWIKESIKGRVWDCL